MDAVDDFETAQLNILPADAGSLNETDSQFSLVGLGPIGIGNLGDQPNVSFTIGEGQTGDATITVSNSDLVGLFTSAAAVVQKRNEDTGEFETLESLGDGGLISLIGIGGGAAQVELSGLESGDYRVFGGSDTGIALASTTTVTANVDLLDHTTIGGFDAETISGNVIDENDTVTPTTVITEVNGDAVSATGTTEITGEYGVLSIEPDGSYSYTPNEDASGIGQVDAFEYTLLDGDGNTDTATLYVAIDSEGQGLTFTDPTQAAEVDLVANDDAAEASIDTAYFVEVGGPSDSGSTNIPGTGAFGGSGVTETVELTFEVDENREANVSLTAASPDRTIVSDSLNVTITGPGGFSESYSGSGGLFSGLGVQEALNGLTEGTYTITATYQRGGGVLIPSGTLSLSYETDSITYLDEFVVEDTNPATGNVLEDDTLGSTYTKLLVDDGTGIFGEVADGTIVNGDHGTLTINANGSYSYEPNPDLGAIGLIDVFTYRLEHPNGTTDDATLSIDVENGDGPYEPPVMLSSFSLEDMDFGDSDDADELVFPESEDNNEEEEQGESGTDDVEEVPMGDFSEPQNPLDDEFDQAPLI
ncbi:BapA/Bap/LapF family large adhesin [Vreelandella alkaliphila]|uniref:BapA/Bap/LapF family large adhesin n=1 Tax=Vreelandella alkaliphila TaxID=272774 RepID=UPI003FD8385C